MDLNQFNILYLFIKIDSLSHSRLIGFQFNTNEMESRTYILLQPKQWSNFGKLKRTLIFMVTLCGQLNATTWYGRVRCIIQKLEQNKSGNTYISLHEDDTYPKNGPTNLCFKQNGPFYEYYSSILWIGEANVLYTGHECSWLLTFNKSVFRSIFPF